MAIIRHIVDATIIDVVVIMTIIIIVAVVMIIITHIHTIVTKNLG
jgi:hypothetical protein